MNVHIAAMKVRMPAILAVIDSGLSSILAMWALL